MLIAALRLKEDEMQTLNAKRKIAIAKQEYSTAAEMKEEFENLRESVFKDIPDLGKFLSDAEVELDNFFIMYFNFESQLSIMELV